MNTVPDKDACPACGAKEITTLCRGSDRLFATTDETFYVVECKGCRLIRLYPRPAPEDLGRYYPERYWYDPSSDPSDRLAELWRRLVLRDHVSFVRTALSRSSARGLVLDVGCGGGLFLRELGLANSEIAGLDFSLEAAAVAWRTNGVPAVCGSLKRAPFPPGSCRMVTMFHVLEHLYEPALYLDAARALLADDGRLVIQVPNAACWQFLLLGEAWNGIDIPRHLIDFRLQDIETLLRECGFEPLRVKHFSLRDNPAGLASSLLPSLDPMGRRVQGIPESHHMRLLKDFTYFAVLLASIPVTWFEALCRAGSTVMVEAKVRQ